MVTDIKIPTSLNVEVMDAKDWGSPDYITEPWVTEFTLYWGDTTIVSWTITDDYNGADNQSFIEEQVVKKLKELWKI